MVLPRIEWTRVDQADYYVLWINGDAEGAKFVYEEFISAPVFELKAELRRGGKYRAWVRAVSLTGEVGIWSNAFEIQVASSMECTVFPEFDLALLDCDREHVELELSTGIDDFHRQKHVRLGHVDGVPDRSYEIGLEAVADDVVTPQTTLSEVPDIADVDYLFLSDEIADLLNLAAENRLLEQAT
jgi:hypothetical protein